MGEWTQVVKRCSAPVNTVKRVQMLFPPHLRLSKILEARKKKKKEKLGGSDDSSSFSFLKFENARRGKREAALGLNAEK